MAHFQDRAYLRESQYRTPDHLTARADLHARFSVNEMEWPAWVLAQLALQPGESVLECGCGPGWLWRSSEAVPEGGRLMITDLSSGMVAEALQAISDQGSTAATADIQTLPFRDHSFDVVVANHMLYHVPDIDRAVAEVARVLRPGGRLVAATNGRGHMQELFELGTAVFPNVPLSVGAAMRSLPFALENGARYLAPWFESVELRPYPSHLAVHEAEPLVAYLLSSDESQAVVSPAERAAVTAALAGRIKASGPIHVSKATGLFLAGRPRPRQQVG